MFLLHVRKRKEADCSVEGRLAAHRLEQVSGARLYNQVEAVAMVAKRRSGALERGGGAGRKPAAEGEEGASVDRHAGTRRQLAENGRRIAFIGPDDEALVLEIDEGIGASQGFAELRHTSAQFGILRGDPRSLADEPYRRQERGAHGAGEDRKLNDLGSAERYSKDRT